VLILIQLLYLLLIGLNVVSHHVVHRASVAHEAAAEGLEGLILFS
jgi:hypothetical protein